jgi:DNA-binding NtrC family response regulator
VLIADDDQFSRDLMVACLRHGGYEVETATDGNVAARKLEAGEFDVCVVDFHLPGKPVDELIGEARIMDSDIAFIIVTGDVSPEAEGRSRKLSPAFFFVKPFDLFDFRSVVDNAISKGRKHERTDY